MMTDVSRTPRVTSVIGVWIHYGIEVRPKLRGIDPGCTSGCFGDCCTRHEAPPPDGAQFPDRRAVSTDDDGVPGLNLPQHGGRLIAKLALTDGADLHDCECGKCRTA